VEKDGILAVTQIHILTPNPYSVEGTARLIYQCDVAEEGLIPAADGGDKSFDLHDPDLADKVFNGVPYPDMVEAVKHCAMYIIGRTEPAQIDIEE
jgi:hypothetical protein